MSSRSSRRKEGKKNDYPPLSDEFRKALEALDELIKRMDKDLKEMRERFEEMMRRVSSGE